MDSLIAFVDAIGRLADSFQRSQTGASLIILLTLALVLGVWCWRRPTKAAGAGRAKETSGLSKLIDLLLRRAK